MAIKETDRSGVVAVVKFMTASTNGEYQRRNKNALSKRRTYGTHCFKFLLLEWADVRRWPLLGPSPEIWEAFTGGLLSSFDVILSEVFDFEELTDFDV
jgi:hypothetical protein